MATNQLIKNRPKITISTITVFALAVYLIYKFSLLAFTQINLAGSDRLFATKVAFLFAAFGVVVAVGFLLSYYLMFIKQMKLEKIFLIFFPLVCIIYILIFLPGGTPDEPVHYWSAYKMSNYLLLNFKQFSSEEIFFRLDDIKNYSLHTKMFASTYADFVNKFNIFAGDVTLTGAEYDTAIGNAIFGYITPAIGIAIGRLFNFSMPIIFYMGRFANVILFTATAYKAIKITPVGKNFFFVYSFLPINLHITASMSYDVLVNALAVLIVAEFLKLYYGNEKINLKDIIKLCIFSVILAPNKLVYLPLAAVPLLLKKERFEEKYQSKHFLLKISVLISAVICILIIQLPRLLSFSNEVSDGHIIEWAQAEGFTVGDIFANPIKTIYIYLNSFRVKGDFYIQSAIGSSLCWLNVNMPFFAYSPFILLLVFSTFKTGDKFEPFNLKQKSYLSVLFIAIVGLVLTSMFLAFTPNTLLNIEGVQGRYFLPLFPLLFIILRNNSFSIKETAANYIPLITLFLSANCISEIFAATFV